MAAQMTLAHWIEVRIFVGQPLKYSSRMEGIVNELHMIVRGLFHKTVNAKTIIIIAQTLKEFSRVYPTDF